MKDDTYPWPRKSEGKPISDPALRTKNPLGIYRSEEFKDRRFTKRWDGYDTLLYNEWLGVRVLPTKVLDRGFLAKLGILEPALQLIKDMGLGDFGVAKHELYADLVRQFMASLRIHYIGGHKNEVAYGELHFKLNGQINVLSMTEFGTLLGLDCSGKLCSIPTAYRAADDLYQLIGAGQYTVNGTKQADVRHPVLRYVLKLLANTLLYKQETSKLRVHELLLLAKGLSNEAFPRNEVPAAERPHLGAVFAHHLLSMQGFPFNNGAKGTVRFGSLLTPIFERYKATCRASKNNEISYLDQDHFIAGDHITAQGEWIFRMDDKEVCMKLPFLEHTGLETTSKLSFRPPEEAFRRYSPTRKRAIASVVVKASAEDQDSTTTSDEMPDPSDYSKQEDVNRWLVQNQKRQNTMILDMLAKVERLEKGGVRRH